MHTKAQVHSGTTPYITLEPDSVLHSTCTILLTSQQLPQLLLALRRVIFIHGGTQIGFAALVISFLLISSNAIAQHNFDTSGEAPVVNKEQAEKFGKLLTQSHDGRLKPLSTLSSELLRKISRKNKLVGQTPEQVILGMLSNPYEWQAVPMIKVKHPEVKEILGVEGKLASYFDFIDMNQGTYKLSKYVSAAYNKKPAKRGMFDKDIIAVDEKLNICYMLYNGE